LTKRIDYFREIEKNSQELKEYYHQLHQHPELSREEVNTQKWIIKKLESWGVECKPCADTGVYAIIDSGKPGKCIALRADMDALPVKEETGLSYTSVNAGVMHACGHDAHMTMLLGCIKVLVANKEKLSGKIVFLFQPSEEGLCGAKRMVKEGVMDNPKVDLAIALHVWPSEVGIITCVTGPVMAQADLFRIDVKGKGGHGGVPHKAVNPIPALAAMIPMIERIPQAILSPHETAVVSVCHLKSGERFNVIPETGYLEGTIRSYDVKVRQDIINQLEKIAREVGTSYGVEGVYSMVSGCPPTINDADAAMWAAKVLETELPNARIITKAPPATFAEDFSEFSKYAPTIYLSLGAWSKEKDKQYPLHNSRFRIDESVLDLGVSVLCVLAEDFCCDGN
jgi:amidohydrolase